MSESCCSDCRVLSHLVGISDWLSKAGNEPEDVGGRFKDEGWMCVIHDTVLISKV